MDTTNDNTFYLAYNLTDVSREQLLIVKEMTFSSFAEEVELLWEQSDTAKLLKLYDKVSNLLDGT